MRYEANGKLILLGEHFVVHGCAALALPLRAVSTTVQLSPADRFVLDSDLPDEARPLAERVARAAFERFGADADRWLVTVRSDIPVGFGLGSSAAYSVALCGAIHDAVTGGGVGASLEPAVLNAHAHALEQLIHGDPSGIDDTVATWGCAVRFVRGGPLERLAPGRALRLVIGSCGYAGSTRDAVASVRRFSEDQPGVFAQCLDRARALVDAGQAALLDGDRDRLGPILDECHGLLATVGVSTPDLERLVGAARSAGALGAKLTGAGWGGFVLALAREGDEPALEAALREAGAQHVMTTELGA